MERGRRALTGLGWGIRRVGRGPTVGVEESNVERRTELSAEADTEKQFGQVNAWKDGQERKEERKDEPVHISPSPTTMS